MGLFIKLRDTANAAVARRYSGIAHYLRSDYIAALHDYQEAIKLARAAGHREATAKTLNNLGVLYSAMGEPRRAMSYYRDALEEYHVLGDLVLMAQIQNNLGRELYALGDLAPAASALVESRRLSKEVEDRRNYSYATNNLGLVLEAQGDRENAEALYRESLAIKKEIGDLQGSLETRRHLAAIESRTGRLKSALERLEEAAILSREIGARSELQAILQDLSQVYKGIGRTGAALSALERSSALRQEIYNERTAEIQAQVEASYAMEKMEREVELLRQREEIRSTEEARRRVLRGAALGGGILGALVLFLLWRQQVLRRLATAERQRRAERERSLRELEVKNEEIELRNAEMERFTYTVSHDLKSPLVTIVGFLGLLERDLESGSKTYITYLERIRGAAQTMARQLDDLLEIARTGRVLNDLRPTELSGVIDAARERLAGTIAERGTEINVENTLPRVMGDKQRLVEVFQNLLENGMKFSLHNETPRIWIRALSTAGRVHVQVRDAGRGIDPRYHERVFELFERLEPEIEGTGTGLALVRRVVETHGGKIWIESEGAGKGTTFHLELPAAV